MKRLVLSVLALIIATTACSPEPVFRLQPEQDKTYRHHGAEYVVSKLEDTEVVVAYYRHLGGMVSMDVEVVNHGNRAVEVDPASFYFRAYEQHPDDGGRAFVRYDAYDPEEEMLKADLAASKAAANLKSAAILDVALEVTSLAAEISAYHNENYAFLATTDAQRVVRSIERSNRYANHDQFLNDLSYRRASWEQDHIRVTDLEPGEFIRGLASFPLIPRATYLEIVIISGSEEHVFPFRQVEFRP